MKNVTKIAALCCMVMMAVTFSACSESESHLYTYGIRDHKFFTSDSEKVFNYLKSMNVPNDINEVFSGKSMKECDEQAKAKFNEIVSNLSHEEVAALGLSEECTFVYAVWRGSEVGTPNEVIAQWEYPKK